MSAAPVLIARAVHARGRRPKMLRPVKPLPAEVVAYSRAMRALLAEAQRRVEGSILTAVKDVTIVHDAEVSDDFIDVLRAVLAILRNTLLKLAAEHAGLIARGWAKRANARHRERFYENVREGLGIDVAGIVKEEGLSQVLRLKTEENVALITSIPMEYLDRVERAVYQHVIHGQPGQKSLADKLQEIGGISERRAKLIARDQTSKLVSAMNRERNLALGLEEYVWRTSKDERVRPTHRAKEGRTFRWDDPPEDTGNPGEDYNCRCTGSPVVKF